MPGNGRAWELLTPPDPTNAQTVIPKAISADGNEFVYISMGPLPDSPIGWPPLIPNLSRRGAGGWTAAPLLPPDPETKADFGGALPEFFGPTLAELVWSSTLPPGQPDWGIFRRGGDGSFELLSRTAPNDGPKGVSEDLSHVLFTSAAHLLPGDADRTEGQSVYEAVGSSVRLVDVDSGGSLLSNCGSRVPRRTPISRDGRRIFFMTKPACSGPTRAYMREDGQTTKLISASACTLPDCGPAADVTIVGATPSGSSAFLVTAEKLTDADGDALADLYRYDAATDSLALLSGAVGAVAVSGDPVVASPDGSRVLFRAGDPSIEEDKRLYLASAAGARLLAPSAGSFVQLSSDGNYALFDTGEALSAADGDESADVYRYDAASDSSTLISGGPGSGGGAFPATIFDGFNGNQAAGQTYRAMSDDGADVFFSTPEPLLPQDRNQASDVYEWQHGVLDLVSAGSGERPSVFVGTTPDGGTAFFFTTLTLLPSDRDGAELDFYAARIGGGFPEPSPPAVCEDEGCLPPLAGPLRREAPASRAGGGGIRILLPRAGALRRNAARGWIRLSGEVPAGGRLAARARAPIANRPRGVAHLSRRVAEAGVLYLRLRLSAAARRALARGEQLRVRLVLRLNPAAIARTVSFELGGLR